jgi:hypothetical protein
MDAERSEKSGRSPMGTVPDSRMCIDVYSSEGSSSQELGRPLVQTGMSGPGASGIRYTDS